MALQYERRHLVFDTAFHKRLPGKGNVPAVATTFCILLTTDSGADDKEALLTADPGTDTSCAQLTTTTS